MKSAETIQPRKIVSSLHVSRGFYLFIYLFFNILVLVSGFCNVAFFKLTYLLWVEEHTFCLTLLVLEMKR